MENPLISIFMPVYNGDQYLNKTLNSIEHQSYKNIEVLCVDDSSTDSSLQILKRHAQKDSRVKVFEKKHGGDVPHSWIYVQPYIKGDYVAYTSQDDLFSSDWIKKSVEKSLQLNLDACIPDVVEFPKGGHQIYSRIGFYGNREIIITGKEAFYHSLAWNISANALWKASYIKEYKFDTFAFNADEYYNAPRNLDHV